MHKNDNRRKEIYHEYDWCYQKFVNEGLNHQEMADEAGTTIRTIKKWCVEKHRITTNLRRDVKKFNKQQEDLILGSLLGDGHITNEKYKTLFIVSHAEDEKDYLYWKYKILKDLCNKPPKRMGAKIKKFGDKEYLAQPSYRIHTRVYDELTKFRDMPINTIINNLNKFSLSVWVLDDGHRERSNWELSIAPYSNEQKMLIVNILNNKFKLACKIDNYDNRYLGFTAEASRHMDEIILKNIPNELDVIKKKITGRDISSPAKAFWVNYKGENFGLRGFCDNHKISYKFAREYYFQGITDGELLIQKCGERIG